MFSTFPLRLSSVASVAVLQSSMLFENHINNVIAMHSKGHQTSSRVNINKTNEANTNRSDSESDRVKIEYVNVQEQMTLIDRDEFIEDVEEKNFTELYVRFRYLGERSKLNVNGNVFKNTYFRSKLDALEDRLKKLDKAVINIYRDLRPKLYDDVLEIRTHIKEKHKESKITLDATAKNSEEYLLKLLYKLSDIHELVVPIVRNLMKDSKPGSVHRTYEVVKEKDGVFASVGSFMKSVVGLGAKDSDRLPMDSEVKKIYKNYTSTEQTTHVAHIPFMSCLYEFIGIFLKNGCQLREMDSKDRVKFVKDLNEINGYLFDVNIADQKFADSMSNTDISTIK